jgi:hypothetical protein
MCSESNEKYISEKWQNIRPRKRALNGHDLPADHHAFTTKKPSIWNQFFGEPPEKHSKAALFCLEANRKYFLENLS